MDIPPGESKKALQVGKAEWIFPLVRVKKLCRWEKAEQKSPLMQEYAV